MDTTSRPTARDEAAPQILPEEITLSHGAMIVFKALLRWKRLSQMKRNLPYCWPSREQIACETAYAVRTVSRHIGELVAAGRIFVIDRHDDTPLYFFDREEWENFQSLAPSRMPRQPSRAKKPRGEYSRSADSDGEETGGRVANVGPGGSANVGPGGAPTLAPPSYKREQTEEEKAVAAALFYLHSELRLPAAKTEKVDPSLVVAVASHVKQRLAIASKKPIGLGYVIACLERPGDFGFTRLHNRWHPPHDLNIAAKLASKEGQQRTQDAGQGTAMLSALEVLEQARRRWFNAIPEADKAAILARLREKAGEGTFYATFPADHPYVIDGCIRLAEGFYRQGKLPGPPPPNVLTLRPPLPPGGQNR